MKLKLFTFLLAVSFSIHAEESPYEQLLIRDQTDLTMMSYIILKQRLTLHNLRNATKDTTKWKDKELRMKSLDCDIQNLAEITLRIIKKNKILFTEQEYEKRLNQEKAWLEKDYISNCDYIKSEDSRVNWKIKATFYPDQ